MRTASEADVRVQGVAGRVVDGLNREQLRALPDLDFPEIVLEGVRDPAKRSALRERRGDATSGGRRSSSARFQEAAVALVREAEAAGPEALRHQVAHVNRIADASGRQRQWMAEWVAELDTARELAADLSAAMTSLVAVGERLEHARAADLDDAARGAAARVPPLVDAFATALAEHECLELRLAHQAMRARRADCELEARKYREGADRRGSLRRRLDGRAGGIARLLGVGKPTGNERERIVRALQRLERRQRRVHAFVATEELREWIGILTGAADHLDEETWERETADTRLLLFHLLNVHALQERWPAERLSLEVLLDPEERETPGYYPAAEHFLKYALAQRGAERSLRGAHQRAARGIGFERARAVLLEAYRGLSPAAAG